MKAIRSGLLFPPLTVFAVSAFVIPYTLFMVILALSTNARLANREFGFMFSKIKMSIVADGAAGWRDVASDALPVDGWWTFPPNCPLATT